MGHEEALVQAFVVPARRATYLARLAAPKSRQRFINRHFAHMEDLDERYAEKLDPGMPLVEFESRAAAHVELIYELLRDRGAPRRCFAVSAEPELDGQEHDLREALDQVVGSTFGTFLSCIPGRLAYFEGESPNRRYILERPPSSQE